MDINPASIKLQRYNRGRWEVLPTVVVNNTTIETVFESQTTGFSEFAITAERKLSSVSDNIATGSQTMKTEDPNNEINRTADSYIEGVQNEKSKFLLYLMAFLVVGVIVGGYFYLKRQ